MIINYTLFKLRTKIRGQCVVRCDTTKGRRKDCRFCRDDKWVYHSTKNSRYYARFLTSIE